MIHWLTVENGRKKIVYEQVAAREDLPPIAIEKDFWVTLILQTIFELEWAEHLVFKGGTSLSKGWGLIQRFSEDVDLAVDRKAFGFEGELSKNQTRKLRKVIREFVVDEFTPALSNALTKKGADVAVEVIVSEQSGADPSVIEVVFTPVTEAVTYLRPRVLVEVNARSLFEPKEEKELVPLVGSLFPQLDLELIPAVVPCVLPKRTFLEKVFLLHEEFQKNPDSMRAERLSRHLYDVESIMDTKHGIEALKDEELYKDIVAHRAHLIKLGGIDYNQHMPGTINLIPPDASIQEWEIDYRAMQESMIYVTSVPFKDLIARMQELMDRINALEFYKT